MLAAVFPRYFCKLFAKPIHSFIVLKQLFPSLVKKHLSRYLSSTDCTSYSLICKLDYVKLKKKKKKRVITTLLLVET